MKYLITFCLLLLGFTSRSETPTFDKLVEVNKWWKDQQDINIHALPGYQHLTETGWIKLHLALVEQTLRKRTVPGLTKQQYQHRLNALDDLHEYWLAGKFPQNENYSYRTPIFIDNHNTFCAVGYLVKASGNEATSRMIASKTNLAYVREMNYPELDQWAADYGFTKEELAWIQPGYPPVEQAAKVGNGVDGEVSELFADDADQKLYVGGSFVNADGSIVANNIAYVTEQNNVYTWHKMGSGVNGPVYAIAKFDNKIYVAGNFTEAGDQSVTNVAYWDGSSWHGAGCTYGTIYDLIVYKNELYACGDFDVCAALSDVNFAKWDGTYWQQMPDLYGRVNTMEVMGDDLVLGGAFVYEGDPTNVIRWNAQSNYHTFDNNIGNEVMDFEWYHDTLYAACKQTQPVQLTNTLMQLSSNEWKVPTGFSFLEFVSAANEPGFNTLCIDGNSMMVGGNFNYMPGMGTYGTNCIAITNGHLGNSNWFLLDSTVNKMVRFKSSLFVGGKFKHGDPMAGVVLNGIARRSSATSIPDIHGGQTFEIFPNPINNNKINIENNFEANQLMLTDISGRQLLSLPLKDKAAKQQVTLPAVASGVYIIGISNAKGEKVLKKVVVD
jgi:hypothetical protein